MLLVKLARELSEPTLHDVRLQVLTDDVLHCVTDELTAEVIQQVVHVHFLVFLLLLLLVLVSHKVNQGVLFRVGIEDCLGLEVLDGSEPTVSDQLRLAGNDDGASAGVQLFSTLMIRERHLEGPKLLLVLAA